MNMILPETNRWENISAFRISNVHQSKLYKSVEKGFTHDIDNTHEKLTKTEDTALDQTIVVAIL